jgi:hypothetical protein
MDILPDFVPIKTIISVALKADVAFTYKDWAVQFVNSHFAD